MMISDIPQDLIEEILSSILAPPRWSRLETEVSKDAARASPCGSPCNGLRSRVLQPTCKFRSGQSSNLGAGTPAGAPIPLDQSNLVAMVCCYAALRTTPDS
uniref:Uncharacterized protein n=1 Tax=Brassica oleracea var. oleracea TaxID=109376 RepID=A0A0D3BCT5_BRAOL